MNTKPHNQKGAMRSSELPAAPGTDHAALRQWCFDRAANFGVHLDEQIAQAARIEEYVLSGVRIEVPISCPTDVGVNASLSDLGPLPVESEGNLVDHVEDVSATLPASERALLHGDDLVGEPENDAFASADDIGHTESPVGGVEVPTVDARGAADKAAPAALGNAS